MEAWYTTALDIEEVLAGAVDSHVHVFVADVIKSFATVDQGILDWVLSSLGLLVWFRPQGCPLSMWFIVALSLPYCRYLDAQDGLLPQPLADNLKCVPREPGLLLRAARFTACNVRLVGQEPAPGKSVLVSMSRAVRRDMRDWLLSQGLSWTY